LELLGGIRCDLPRRHPGAQPRSRKNYEDAHKELSIPGVAAELVYLALRLAHEAKAGETVGPPAFVTESISRSR